MSLFYGSLRQLIVILGGGILFIYGNSILGSHTNMEVAHGGRLISMGEVLCDYTLPSSGGSRWHNHSSLLEGNVCQMPCMTNNGMEFFCHSIQVGPTTYSDKPCYLEMWSVSYTLGGAMGILCDLLIWRGGLWSVCSSSRIFRVRLTGGGGSLSSQYFSVLGHSQIHWNYSMDYGGGVSVVCTLHGRWIRCGFHSELRWADGVGWNNFNNWNSSHSVRIMNWSRRTILQWSGCGACRGIIGWRFVNR